MKFIKLKTLLAFIIIGCNSCTEEVRNIPKLENQTTYVSISNPKTRLVLKDSNQFEYFNIPSIAIYGNLFFKTSGRWEMNSNKLILISSKDSLEPDLATTYMDTAVNGNISDFVFLDSYNDTIGFWYVKYPDGRPDANGADLQDRNYWWKEDMRKTESLEFIFSGYKPYKCISDGLNHNYRVVLHPIFKPNVFQNHVLLKISSDSLMDTSKSQNNIFKKLK